LRNTTGFLFALTIGALLGLGLTWFSLRDGPVSGVVTVGSWRAWPALGSAEIDPYGRAHVARTGDLPLGAGEGIAFLATSDDGGTPLDGRCRYRISSIAPAARWWSLAVYGPNRRPIDNPAERTGFTSAEVTRRADGVAEIVLGPTVRSGDWLPTRPGRISLMLRLYDTPIATALAGGQSAELPVIVAEGCE
jgi:hypothetical protein